jgi:type 1 fimbria pilin
MESKHRKEALTNMKNYFAALSATALISVAPFAVAASSTDLTVTGVITPQACTPSLSNGGIIDNGKISAKDLNLDTNTRVGVHPMQLSVTCSAPMAVALYGIDNQASSTLADNYFGLGFTDKGEKIGIFRADIKSAMADGSTLTPIRAYDISGTRPDWVRIEVLGKDQYTSAGTSAPGGRYIPSPVENLTMDLEVVTYIAPANSLTLTDEIKMDGSATFELTYL